MRQARTTRHLHGKRLSGPNEHDHVGREEQASQSLLSWFKKSGMHVIDARGAFDPFSAAQAGVNLRRLLWVRGDRHIGHAFKAADLILHAGGFGLVVLDLCEVPARELNSIPLSYWYRFRLAVENTPTRLIVAADQPVVKSCARVQLEVKRQRLVWEGAWRGPVFAGIDFEIATRKARLQLAG